MIIIISKIILLACSSEVGFVPTNSLPVGFECIIFVPTLSIEFFRSPVKNFAIGFTVTGGKFRVYETFPSRHDVS